MQKSRLEKKTTDSETTLALLLQICHTEQAHPTVRHSIVTNGEELRFIYRLWRAFDISDTFPMKYWELFVILSLHRSAKIIRSKGSLRCLRQYRLSAPIGRSLNSNLQQDGKLSLSKKMGSICYRLSVSNSNNPSAERMRAMGRFRYRLSSFFLPVDEDLHTHFSMSQDRQRFPVQRHSVVFLPFQQDLLLSIRRCALDPQLRTENSDSLRSMGSLRYLI